MKTVMIELVGNEANRHQVHVSSARQAPFFNTYHDTISNMQHMQTMIICRNLQNCNCAICKQTPAVLLQPACNSMHAEGKADLISAICVGCHLQQVEGLHEASV